MAEKFSVQVLPQSFNHLRITQ